MNTISAWDIYWITRLDNLSTTFALTAALCGFVVFFGLMYSVIELEDEERRGWLRKIFGVAIFGALMVIGGVLTPSTKEMCAIIVLPRVVNNQDVQVLGADLPKLARAWLEELMPKTTDKAKGE